MEEKGIFRTSIGGFNKKQVLSYIDQITGEWDEERCEMAAEVQEQHRLADEARSLTEDLQTQLTGLAGEVERLRPLTEENAALQAQLAEVRERADALATEKEALTRALTDEKESGAAVRAEMASAEERLREWEAEFSRQAERVAQMEEQQERYESVLGQGDRMRTHIDGVVRPYIDDTGRRADETLGQVEQMLDGLMRELAQLQEEVGEQRQIIAQDTVSAGEELTDSIDEWLRQSRQTRRQTVPAAAPRAASGRQDGYPAGGMPPRDVRSTGRIPSETVRPMTRTRAPRREGLLEQLERWLLRNGSN